MVCGAPAKQLPLPGEPSAASAARHWVADQITHPYAELLAGELFTAVLATGSSQVLMTVSSLGGLIRITVYGSLPVSLAAVSDVGRQILAAVADRVGVAPDMCGLWVEVPAEG